MPEEVRRAAGLLERRWTISILWASSEGALRFNELKQSLGEIPPRVEYRLTDEGRRLKHVVDAVVRFAAPAS